MDYFTHEEEVIMQLLLDSSVTGTGKHAKRSDSNKENN